ncbi:hypothetical protein [Psychrobacter sp. DAB_AL32B]|uniref:hypothetical protein n=1 Tax=Psychrobacter sp. DAB_AL32B TaxID=1028414 RepID=UPI000B7CF919|nr:hypothetical protein [Psychrobacter sp. DAB_AL32B]OXL25781.1 hypothetical protein CAN34_03885 [Psychrobacter sp. DAB_AL32B]
MINHKDQARIDELIEILHHGVGLNDASIKGTLRIMGKKLTDEIPLGAESPTFIARKRLILIGLQAKRLNALLKCLVSLISLFIFVVMIWAVYPNVKWWLLLIVFILTYWLYSSIRDVWQIGRLIPAIKSIEQIYTDPILSVQNQRVHDVGKYARQFAKPRFITRLIALFIMVMSAYLMVIFYAEKPMQLLGFYFLAPFMFMIAVGLIFYPINKVENMHLYGITQMPYKYMPFGFKLCLLIGLVLSVVMLGADWLGVDAFNQFKQ